MERKITEAMILTQIKEVIGTVEMSGEVTAEDVIAYCDKKMAQAAKKAEQAKAKRAEKAAENDELFDKVKNALTDEFQSGQDIADALEITKGKAVNRLSKLVAEGVAVKEQIKTADGNKVMAYKLA